MMRIDKLLVELDKKNIRLSIHNGRLNIKAPKGVLTSDLRNKLAAHKSEILLFLNKSEVLPIITPQPEQRYEPFPLTDIQHAYWLGRNSVFDLGNISTHGYFEYDCTHLDLTRLSQAWQLLIDRHEMLRMVINTEGQQCILAETPAYEIVVTDLQTLETEEQNLILKNTREEMSHHVFNPECWPLFSVSVSKLGTSHFRLHVSVDFLMIDGFSYNLLFSEWYRLYLHPEKVSEPLKLSFRDYILAERQLETGVLYQNAKTYWLDRMSTLPTAPELPLERQPHEIKKPTFKRYAYQLPVDRWNTLKQTAKLNNISPTETLMTAFALILAKWSKNPHFMVNLTLFNRLPIHPQVMELIGDFTNLNLLEINVKNATSFVALAQNIQQQLRHDLDHAYFGGVRVLRELSQRKPDGQVLMPVVFTSILGYSLDSGDSFFGESVYGISQTSQVWLDHQVAEAHGELFFNWDVVPELFPEGMWDDMFTAYCDLLEQLASDKTVWQDSHLSLIPQQQLSQREAINAATTTTLSNEMLHTLFLAQVKPHASQLAVITPTKTLTYEELYQYANQVGHWLRDQGVKPNTLVAIIMEKGWEQVVAVLGIHLSGAAYLPIDPNLPTERLHYLLEQGETTTVLSQSWLAVDLESHPRMRHLTIDTLAVNTMLPALSITQIPTDLAYVIYTSGSTGYPKGVMIDHRGAVNTVLAVNQRYNITANDRVLAISALNFDLSVYDIFGLLAVGGTIVMPDAQRRIDPRHWSELINQMRITLWNTVPILMEMLVDYQEDSIKTPQLACEEDALNTVRCAAISSPLLRVVMMSGDWIPVTLPDRIKALWPGVNVYGMGGATEASIWSIDYPIGKVNSKWSSIPYGKPMKNQFFHVFDAHFNPCPVWVSGDLYIGGLGLALGYWKDEERTKTSFINHPRTGIRLYKTGDLGRYLPDGNIEFLGRDDSQVKIKGHRIELGEIENTLLQHPNINKAVVNAVGDPKKHRQLVAYVVSSTKEHNNPHETQYANFTEEIQQYLTKKLPNYMIPSAVISLDRLPITVNGKIDRKALPLPDLSSEQQKNIILPRTPTEKKLSTIWQEILDLEQIGIYDNFFTIGGDSLIATKVISRVNIDFNIDLIIPNIFEHAMLIDFADLIENVLWLQNKPFNSDTNIADNKTVLEGEI